MTVVGASCSQQRLRAERKFFCWSLPGHLPLRPDAPDAQNALSGILVKKSRLSGKMVIPRARLGGADAVVVTQVGLLELNSVAVPDPAGMLVNLKVANECSEMCPCFGPALKSYGLCNSHISGVNPATAVLDSDRVGDHACSRRRLPAVHRPLSQT
eukprot:COSAG06_NODE_14566_length_1146_cov_1.703916_1_plen_156_part_00